MRINKKRLAQLIVYGVCILFILWIGISFIEVICNNLTEYQYSSLNAFSILLDAYKAKNNAGL